MKEIAIIGKGPSLIQVVEAAESMNPRIKINGFTYEQKQEKRPGKALSMLMAAANELDLIMGGGRSFGQRMAREGINIVAEFALIQQKKSDLSRRKRDWVEARFHRMFKLVQ